MQSSMREMGKRLEVVWSAAASEASNSRLVVIAFCWCIAGDPVRDRVGVCSQAERLNVGEKRAKCARNGKDKGVEDGDCVEDVYPNGCL